MRTTNTSIRRIAIACALCAAAGSTLAQTAKQQSVNTIKKEINAAYAEQKAACAKGARSERASCLDQARQVHRKDMANAGQLVADAPVGGVNERVVSTVERAGDGAGAVGSSQGGATASGGDGALEPQPMQPPSVSTPPRSQDTPIQR